MWRCEDVDQQMWRCEDVDQQMWGCEDVDLQMWRCEDVDLQMWRCEDVDLQMWKCEDVDLQMYYNGCFFTKTPSQALSGKNNRTARKSAQRFHQFSCSWWCSSWWKPWYLQHFYIIWWCLVAPQFHWDLWTINVLLQWEQKKCMMNTLKKRYVFGSVSTCIFWLPLQ